MTPKIKICGMTNIENIGEVLQLKPDFLGFIFHPTSPRCVTGKAESAQIRALNTSVITTGVFVDASTESMLETAKEYGLKAIQLHGNEQPEVCAMLQKEGYIVIKTFGMETEADLDQTEQFAGCTDFFLFDTRSVSHGGTGQIFNWNILKNKTITNPWILAGGLSPENIDLAIATGCHALDLNSRFELKPGIKDVERLRRAITLIRNRK